jgi:hypothetical protein
MHFTAAIINIITGKERSSKLDQVATLQTRIYEMTGYNIRRDPHYSDGGSFFGSFPPAHPGECQDSTSY